MRIITDFHIHSKYSRAVSKEMDLNNLNKWAQIKGIDVLGTGDFTHPQWLKELKENLEPAEEGLFKLKNINKNFTRFILTTEVSCIYSKKGRVRKIHILIFVPDFRTAERINKRLDLIGNLSADGRPILGLDAKELVKIVLNISPQAVIIPAHLWTPWFGILGSKSGFDSFEECFEEWNEYIFAAETGLSSNPAMNWRLSKLDDITLISNSDAHSPQKIGREANVFNIEISYSSIINAIRFKNKEKFLYTIEFFPEEGKYHYDGHRGCGVSCSSEETRKYGGVCPVCGKSLTIGVMSRVEELADRKKGFLPSYAIPFKSLVPLKEIIADALDLGTQSKKVEGEYFNLVNHFENEFRVLLDVGFDDLKKITSSRIAEAIIKVREGKVYLKPGYDGVFGRITVFPEKIKFVSSKSRQNSLF